MSMRWLHSIFTFYLHPIFNFIVMRYITLEFKSVWIFQFSIVFVHYQHHHHLHQQHHHHHHHHHHLFFSSFLLRPSRGMGLALGSIVESKLFKRGDWVGYTQSTLLPYQLLGRTVTWAIEPAFSDGAWLNSLPQVINIASILNLCEMNHYHLKGRVSLCPLITTRRSITMG